MESERNDHKDSQIMDFPFEKLYNQLGENDAFIREIYQVAFDFSEKKIIAPR